MSVGEPAKPLRYTVRIRETKRVQHPETGVFEHENTGRFIEWKGTAADSDAAEEIGMAVFEAQYGARPRYYRSAAEPDDLPPGTPRIRAVI